jgi:hypothetical protein
MSDFVRDQTSFHRIIFCYRRRQPFRVVVAAGTFRLPVEYRQNRIPMCSLQVIAMSQLSPILPSLQRLIRLDENRYAGDALISHADYQVFLDDLDLKRVDPMLEGVRYMPDHWLGSRFPIGQEDLPIVGVRRSGAVAFCNWLTEREGNPWRYRLPEPEELDNHPLQDNLQGGTYLGYWTNGRGINKNFTWIGESPPLLALERVKRELDISRLLARARDMDTTHILTHIRLEQDGPHGLNVEIVPYIIHALFPELPSSLLRLDTLITPDCNRDRILDRNVIFELAWSLAFDLGIDRTRETGLAHCCDLIVRLLMTRERMEGRLPAFEGIRIVMEKYRLENGVRSEVISARRRV